MKTQGEKQRWIQAGLAVLIILILVFLVVSPGARAAAWPADTGYCTPHCLTTTRGEHL